MMPVPDAYADTEIDYKQKYKALKKRLKLLVYEQECFLEELRKAQRKLLKVARDRSFLLDRLLQYEKVDDSSGDSEATASSDSDGEGHHRDGVPAKRKRVSGHGGGSAHSLAAAVAAGEVGSQLTSPSTLSTIGLPQVVAGGSQEPVKKRAKTSVKKSKASAAPKATAAVAMEAMEAPTPSSTSSLVPTLVAATASASSSSSSTIPGQMTREELERHLDAKQNVFGIEKATASLPMDIFSNDNSNHASDTAGNGGTGDDEDEDLVIDIPH